MNLLQKHPRNEVVGEELPDGAKEIKRDEDGAHVENASITRKHSMISEIPCD